MRRFRKESNTVRHLGPPVAHSGVMRKFYARARGFTLTELMIVIVIMGILAAISIPAVAKLMQSWRLAGETDQFASFLLRARSAAVTKNTMSVFKFKMSNGTYFYFEDRDEDGMHDSDEYQSETHTLTPGIAIKEHTLSGPILVFGPRGNANESGVITFSNPRGHTRTVSVFGGTGNIKTN